MNTRSERSIRNIVWAIIQKLVVVLLPFLVRTVLISRLGIEYAGLSGLFSSILSVLSLSELGFGSAMVFSMYRPIRENNEQEICELLHFYRSVYRLIGLFTLGIGALVFPFLPKLIHGTYPDDISIYAIYAIYLINLSISYFLFAYKAALLTAYQRNDAVSKIGTICYIVLYLSQIIVIYTTSSFYLYAICLPVSTALANILYNFLSQRYYPSLRCRGRPNSETVSGIRKRVTGAMLHKVCSATRTSFDSIVISTFLGLSMLAKYQNYFLVVSSVSGVFAVICNAVTASVGDSIVSKSRNENHADFEKILFVYMWVVSCATSCMATLYQPFIIMWVGESMIFDNWMVVLFCLYFYIQTMGDVVYVYRSAAGLWWKDRVRPAIETIANITLNLILVRYMGIKGVILATILTLLFLNFAWGAKILFHEYFTINAQSYFRDQFFYASSTILAVAISKLVCDRILLMNIWVFLIKLVLCITISSLVFFVLFRKTSVFRSSKSMVLCMVNNIRKWKYGR